MKKILYILLILTLAACSKKLENSSNEQTLKVSSTEDIQSDKVVIITDHSASSDQFKYDFQNVTIDLSENSVFLHVVKSSLTGTVDAEICEMDFIGLGASTIKEVKDLVSKKNQICQYTKKSNLNNCPADAGSGLSAILYVQDQQYQILSSSQADDSCSENKGLMFCDDSHLQNIKNKSTDLMKLLLSYQDLESIKLEGCVPYVQFF